MIKTEYLGWELDEIFNTGDGMWNATYFKSPNWTQGVGHTPESALADAQKKIQLKRDKHETTNN